MAQISRKDEYKKVKIPFGFNEKTEKVALSLFHSFFVAMTGHGKTLGMKSLLLRFHELFPEWRILIIDSKDKRDYADLNADIPICFVETTEPLDLKNLLEPILGAKMIYFFDKIIEEAVFDTLGDIQRNIQRKIDLVDEGKLKMHAKEVGKLRVINHLLKKLVVLVEQPNIVPDLRLHEGFNVMAVSLPHVKNPHLKRAFQQLITRSVLIQLLSDQTLEGTLLVLDENHKWNPQRYGSICKQPLSEFISEGRSQNKIVWMSDQALTKVDKEALKNVKIWIVGQQMEDNEVEDAVHTVNDITDLKVSNREIKTLRVGTFVLVDGLHGTVEKVYLQPCGVPDDIAIQIVKGGNPELAEPFILEFESKLRGDEDLMYKELYETTKHELDKTKEELKNLQLNFAELQTTISSGITAKIEEVRKEVKAASERTIKSLTEQNANLSTEKAKLEESLQKIREGFATIFPQQIMQQTSETIDLEHKELIINIQHKGDEEVKMATNKVAGQILYCATNDLPKQGFITLEMKNALLEHGWNIKDTTLSAQLSVLANEGRLIKTEKGYRLPTKVKFNITKLAVATK